MNQSYPAFRTALMTGAVDLDTAVIKVALVGGYTFNAGHTSMADLTGAGGVINGSATLTGVTVSGGVFDAADVQLTTNASSNPHILVIYQASAVTGGSDVTPANQRLCLYLDSGDNLPVVPGAGTVTIAWPNSAAKIYRIGA